MNNGNIKMREVKQTAFIAVIGTGATPKKVVI